MPTVSLDGGFKIKWEMLRCTQNKYLNFWKLPGVICSHYHKHPILAWMYSYPMAELFWNSRLKGTNQNKRCSTFKILGWILLTVYISFFSGWSSSKFTLTIIVIPGCRQCPSCFVWKRFSNQTLPWRWVLP